MKLKVELTILPETIEIISSFGAVVHREIQNELASLPSPTDDHEE